MAAVDKWTPRSRAYTISASLFFGGATVAAPIPAMAFFWVYCLGVEFFGFWPGYNAHPRRRRAAETACLVSTTILMNILMLISLISFVLHDPHFGQIKDDDDD